MMKKRVTVTAMMMAVMLSWPMEALCQTKVTAGKDVKTIGVTAAAEGSQEVVTQIDEEGREVLAVEGSTVRVTGNAPEAGKVARLKISKIPGSEVVLTQGIWVYGQNIISGGETIQLSIGVSPAYANPHATWSIEDCDERGEKLNGTQNNASLSEDHKLTGLKMGYVKVTASATDGSGVKGSKIFEVSSNAPTAETSAIGGGESAAFFSPGVPSKPSLVDANPNSGEMNFITGMTRGLSLGVIMEMAPNIINKLGDYNTIIGKKALRLVNYHQGTSAFISCNVKINCNQGNPGDPVVFLMLYSDTNNGNLTGKELDLRNFKNFHDDLIAQYSELLSGETPLLHRIKEFWSFWEVNFPEDGKTIKKMRKAKSLAEYMTYLSSLIS